MDKDFERPFESKCLRCGMLISVTEELIHQASLPARPALSPPARSEAVVQSPGNSAVAVATKSDSSDEPALDAETSPKTNASASKYDRDKNKKISEDKKQKKPAKRAEEKEEAEEEEVIPERKPSLPPRPPPPKTPTGQPRRQLIVAAASIALVVFGAAGYLMFGGKKTEPKQVAKPKPTPKPTVKPAPKVVKIQEPPPKIPDKADLIVSAARLSAELAANADIANNKYMGKLLEVSGIFSKIEKKDGLRPPPRQHAVFATSGAPVSCDLEGGPTPVAAWMQLKPEKPFTMRGKYEKNGYLHECYLLPDYVSTADNRYKGKTIQVSGRIARIEEPINKESFPRVVFEGETNSLIEVRCFFRATDKQEVSKIQSGSMLTIQGECNGRQTVEGASFVRVDNCELVYTSAPPDNIPRVDVHRLLREYEEDTRMDFLPMPGEEERIEKVWTIREMAKEWSGDSKAFVKKYGNRILRVGGKIKTRGDRLVVLVSGDTDLRFQIDCRFDTASFEAIRGRREAEYRIRGLFVGEISGRGLRLENCQLDMPRQRGPVVSTDYLPFKQGRSFTIDIATFDVKLVRKTVDVVQREVHVQGRDGVTEILVTQRGPLPGKSLFDEGVQEKWSQQTQARIKKPATNGIYSRRMKAGFIELGTPFLTVEGKPDIAWMPVLKIGVRAGEKWQWEPVNGLHEYEVEKIDDVNGRPCAFIREIITMSADVLHPIEILHVYAQGLGEVERRQWRLLDQRGTKVLLSEMKWVDNPTPGDRALSAPTKK